MAAAVGSIFVGLTADARPMVSGFNRAGASVSAFGRRTELVVSQTESRLARLRSGVASTIVSFKGLAAGVGIVGFAGLARSIQSIVNEASGLAKTADRIGTTTDALQELRYAASLADIDVANLDSGMQIFGRNLGAASQGQGDLLKVLQANNIALRDQSGNVRSTADLLADFADLIARAGSAQERLRLATVAFGRGGAEMVTMLAGGSAALRDTADEAHRLGLVLREDLLRDAERVADDWTRFTSNLSTKFKFFVLTTVSGVDDILDKFRELDSRTSLSGIRQDLERITTEMQKEAAIIDALKTTGTFPGLLFTTKGTDELLAEHQARFDQLTKQANEYNQRLLDLQAPRPRSGLTPVDETILPTSGSTGDADARRRARELEAAAIRDATYVLDKQNAALARNEAALAAATEAAKDFMSGFVSDVREGKSAVEALGDAVNRLADRLLSMATDHLVERALGGLFGAGGVLGRPVLSGVGASLFHRGGVVGSTIVPKRSVPLGSFANPVVAHTGLVRSERAAMIVLE